jgi:hypothetical protein
VALRLPVLAAAIVYAVFAASCFRLAVVYPDDHALGIGEGAFTLLGAIALAVAAFASRGRAAVAFVGTVPLVGWFLATPWNSGPPFLVASLVAPVLVVVVTMWRHVREA